MGIGAAPHSPSDATIRFGIMCAGYHLPAWQAAAVRTLLALPRVEIALLVIAENSSTKPRARLKRLGDRPRLLWNLFNKGYVERRSVASRPIDMSSQLDSVPTVRCRTEMVGKFGERLAASDIATIASFELDFLLRFSFGILKGEILTTPRWGVWSFHHGDERIYRGRPPGFWELVAGERVVGSVLQRLTDRLDAGVILYRGFFKAVRHSYRRTRDEILLGSSEWPAAVVQTIRSGDANPVDAPASATTATVRRDPTNGVMLGFLMRQAIEFLRSQWRGLTAASKWNVGIADVPIAAFLEGGLPPIHWLPEQGPSRYLADPFAVMHEDSIWAMVEDYDYRDRRGVISAVRMSDHDPKRRRVIDTGTHASYPCLIQWDDQIWCVPETYQAREVRLYRAIDFPDAWELEAVLIEGLAALDPTVLHHEGRWWLFCTDQHDGPNTKLRIWHSAHLTGPWMPHAINPVKTDIRSSRPGGTPFVLGDALYRPAQNGSESYGGSVTFNRVKVLTQSWFSEEAVATIGPMRYGPYRDGIHTISAVGDRTVVDARRDTFIPSAFRRELMSRLGRMKGRGAG